MLNEMQVNARRFEYPKFELWYSKNKIKIEAIQNLWANRSAVYAGKNGDQGLAIIGDGIEIYAYPKFAKLPCWIMLIPSSRVAIYKGSVHYEETKDEVMGVLTNTFPGVEFRYNYGRMS